LGDRPASFFESYCLKAFKVNHQKHPKALFWRANISLDKQDPH